MIKKILILSSIFIFNLSCSSSILDDPSTTIGFSISERSHVKLTVENSYGTIISTLVDREMDAGVYSVMFDAADLAEGVYYYTIEVRGLISSSYYKKTRTMLLVK